MTSPRAHAAALALTASTLAFCLVLLDTTLVTVALPAIADDLGAGVAGLQWVVNAFPLVLATLVMSAGALADRLGAKRVLLAGVAIVLFASLFAATADSLEMLVAAQATLGIGAALLLPSSLTLLSHAYPDPARRAVAVGIWASATAVVFAASPLAAGLLIHVGGWRAVFAVNVPFALAVAAFLLCGAPDTPRRRGHGLDLGGQCAAMVGLAALTFALIESRPLGWGSSAVMASLAVFVAASFAFLAIERRIAAPMLPLDLFTAPGFSWSIVAGMLVSFALFGQLFVLSLYLQEGRGLSPAETGLVYLAMPAVVAAIGIPSGRLIGRFGPGPALIVGGVAGVASSLLLLATLGASTPYEVLVVALGLSGVAAGTVVPAFTSAAVSSVAGARIGVASSALNAARQTGAVLGVAVLGGQVSPGDAVSGLPTAMVLCTLALAGVVLAGVRMRVRRRIVEAVA